MWSQEEAQLQQIIRAIAEAQSQAAHDLSDGKLDDDEADDESDQREDESDDDYFRRVDYELQAQIGLEYARQAAAHWEQHEAKMAAQAAAADAAYKKLCAESMKTALTHEERRELEKQREEEWRATESRMRVGVKFI